MGEAAQSSSYRPFTPWTGSADRSCWTCAHAIGYDGVHLWCERFRLVVIDPCGCWERGSGCDKAEPVIRCESARRSGASQNMPPAIALNYIIRR